MTAPAATVDGYLASLPEGSRAVVARLRARVHALLPDVSERISYQIPTFCLDGRPVVYLAAWTTYVSVYPLPRGDPAFDAAIAPYVAGKGTVHFPVDQPVPVSLFDQMVTLLGRRTDGPT